MAKVFISYTGVDRAWAHWIGVTLRDNGHVPFVHEWEVGAGQNVPRWMEQRIREADHLLGVFSNAYARGVYSNAERWAAYWQDPEGRDGFLVPVEVETVTDWPPLARPLNRLSLVGKTEGEAEEALLAFLEPPAPPATRPPFPGAAPSATSTAPAAGGNGSGTPSSFIDRSEPLPAARPTLPSAESSAGASGGGGGGRSKPPGEVPSGADEVPDPSDRDAFEAWLRSKPGSCSVVIAARAALRALPFVRWRKLTENDAATIALPIFRATAVSRFASVYTNHKTANAADNAAVDMSIAAEITDIDLDAVRAEAAAKAAARFAAYAVARAGDAKAAATAAVYAGDATGFAATAATRADARQLSRGVPPAQLARVPLWPTETDGIPSALTERRNELAADLGRLGSHWRVWLNWYDEILAGSPPSPERSEAWDAAFTDVNEPLPWDDGPEAVNLAIQARLDALSVEEASAEIPDQTAAPVRVEERGGKVASVRDRDSPLRASERDFEAWREPVVEHIQELASGDFAEGTNHSRIRDRLVSLGRLLPGDIADVKERQFRIGYEIERFERLIAAYRSGGDDMPAMNAASLEDLEALRIALSMGVDKLERWGEFRRLAAADPKREGEADREAVGEAMDEMAADMERKPAYFDPELPASFRFLAEAVKDPLGATKTIVYGAVKSVENLFSFLGRRALGLGRKVFDEAEKPIPKAVAASLLLGLADAALKLSEALPQGWAWLEPLLASLARSSGL